MFFVLFMIGAAVVVTTAIKRGSRPAAAIAFAPAMALPCWSYRESAVRLDVRTAVALVGMLCIALHRETVLGWRVTLTDFLVLALVVVLVASEYLTSVATLTVVIDLVVQWLLPYVFGRMVWQSKDDGRRILPAMAFVAAFLGGWAVVESVTRVNPIGTLFGQGGSLQSMYDLRWGMRRAEGPLTHPIFFGLQLVLLFPFALAAVREAGEGNGPAWWRYTPWIVAAGTFFTMSRGPQLGLIILMLTVVVLLAPCFRTLILLPSALVIMAGFAAGGTVVTLLERWSGEQSHLNILIRGEQVPYTGTMHRLLQLRVYSEAVEHAGWLGYGSIALRSGQSKIPYIEEHLRDMFFSIDNHYLQFVLQNGFLGLALFLALCLAGVANAASCIAGATTVEKRFAAGLAGSLFVLTLLMANVWLGSDYRFVLFVMLGVSAGMRVANRPEPVEVVAPQYAPLVPLRLSPGYSGLARG